METFLPRLLSIILLLISIAMFVPIGSVVVHLAHGSTVAPLTWAVPLGILATASIMMWLLTRKAIPLRLYLAAFALWVVTAGYFFFLFR
jgi:uncharacterized membrane protein YcaP (DUF421 family)